MKDIERSMNMVKKVIKHIGKALLYIIICGALAPLYHIVDAMLFHNPDAMAATLAQYTDPYYWLIIVAAVGIVYPTVIYFREFRPRTFVHLYDVVWATAATCLLIGGEVAALMFVLFRLSEHKVLMIFALIACGAVFLFGLYAIICRGVAIYQNGKVRVFKFRVYTYPTDTVDDLRLEYRGKQCIVHVVVQGDEHLFRVSKGSAELIEKRLEQLKKNGILGKIDE